MPRRGLLGLLLFLTAFLGTARGDSDDALGLIERWLDAQNQGDFDTYQRLYAGKFEGIRRSGAKVTRLDRAGWVKDRERMFRSKMVVSAADRKVEPYGSGYRVTFTQTWASGKYKDMGTKELIVLDEDGELRIFREEMLQSVKDLGIKGPALLVWDAGSAAATAGSLDAAERVAAVLSTVVEFPSGFPTRLEGGVNGVGADEAVVALGVCTPAEAAAVIDLFRQLGPRVSVRETTWKPRTKGTACPVFWRGWTWPGTAASASLGGDTLTVAALRREDPGRGGENFFVGALRGKDGAVRRIAAFKGGSDLAALETLDKQGAAVVAREKFDGKACEVIVQTLRFEVKDGEIEKRVGDREVSERAQCPR